MSKGHILRRSAALVAVGGFFVGGMVFARASDPSGSSNEGPGHAAPTQASAAQPADVSPTFVPSPQSQTYVPLTPCRIVDTRVAGGKISAHQTRSFAVSGDTGFPAQGGHSSGCGIPTTATAVSISIIAVSPTSGGYLTAWPAGAAQPLASVLNFGSGASTNTGLTVSITSADPALSVYLGSAAAVDVVIDVYGYYEPQTHLIILADGTVWYGNGTHVTGVTHTSGSGFYNLTFDRSLAGCNVLTTDNDNQNVRVAASWGGISIAVNTFVRSGSSFTSADESFQVFVAC